MNFLLHQVFLSLVATASGQSVIQILARTADVSDAGCDTCKINVELINVDYDTCLIQDLDNDANNWQRGITDSFQAT